MPVRAVRFAHLDPWGVYAIAQLRQLVFVVEQECAYPDLDGADTDAETWHVLLDSGDGGGLLGYARVLNTAVRRADDSGKQRAWRIGRVCLTPEARGQGYGDALVRGALGLCPGRPVVLDAQAPLVEWYATFGFTAAGPEFLEDGIAHVPMRRD